MHKKQSEGIMKRSNTLQSMGSYTIRRNMKRMVAMTMTVLMVTSVIGDSGLSYVNAQPQNDSIYTVTSENKEELSQMNEVPNSESFGSLVVIWLILGIISIVVIAGTTIYIKKEKSEIEDYEG